MITIYEGMNLITISSAFNINNYKPNTTPHVKASTSNVPNQLEINLTIEPPKDLMEKYAN